MGFFYRLVGLIIRRIKMQDYEELNLQQEISETDPFSEDRYRLFNRFLPQDVNRILDVGCNTGRGGAVLKAFDPSRSIYGLDIVKDRLSRLPTDVYTDNLHGSCTAIPIEDGYFNAIVSGEFIEHLYSKDVDATLHEMFRVLSINGVVLLTTPNPGDIKRRLRKETVLGGAHLSQHHASCLKMKLRMIGFSSVSVYGSGKVTRYLGCRFPYLNIYGSYMIRGVKF